MNYKPLGGYFDLPCDKAPENPHLGLTFDYEFAGKPMGEQLSLLIHSWIIDHPGNIFSRKANYFIPRPNAVECISKHIKDHLIAMGVDDMSCRRLMRDFEVDKKKVIASQQ